MSNIFLHSLVDTWQMASKVLIILFVALYISQVLMELGLFKKLEFIGAPLAKIANLPQEAGATFVASFGSVLAGNMMIAKLYTENRITKKQTFLSAILNTVPANIRDSLMFQIPVMLPVLGFKVGIVYLSAFFSAGIMKVLFVIVCGIGDKEQQPEKDKKKLKPEEPDEKAKKKIKTILINALVFQKKIFVKLGFIFVLMTYLIFLLINSGIVADITEYAGPVATFFKLPPACAIAIGTYILSPLVGAASIGVMLQNGTLTDIQGITACLLGSILMLPVFSLRFSLARYTSIFGIVMGSWIVTVSTALGMFTRALFLLVIFCL